MDKDNGHLPYRAKCISTHLWV